jgi:carbamoyltransferase
MAYNILGISVGHNGSAAVVSDGNLIYYLEEERLSRMKRDGNPFRAMIDICSKYEINELIIGGTNDDLENNIMPWTFESPYSTLIRKFYPKVKVTWANHVHHSLHASCAYFNSGFKKSSIIIIDGAGSKTTHNNNIISFECESIWEGDEKGLELISKSSWSPIKTTIDVNNLDNDITLTKTYEAVTQYLGWQGIEGGKTMGLAPYGKQNSKIPQLFKNGRGNKSIFIPNYPAGSCINELENPIFQRNHNPKEWHTDPSKLTEIEVDLAWQIQNDTQEEVAKLIEKSVELTGNKQICIAGGYGLNCVTNYWLKKRFPDLEIYHEPISHDGGTAIGAAYLGWKNYQPNTRFTKQTSIYYGPQYTTDQLESTLQSYNNMFNIYEIKPENVAKLIAERNIVTIFQGRSEAGPRALGNRSILYDPTDPNGKDYVNKVKNREWFRPFAGSVLQEKAHEWFDMAGLEESPFMMYAMDVWPDKQEQIKAITHVDGTCRIQTVKEEQNPHYYKLIQEFEKITGVPILFNTSFNLAGDPLVETIEDALETMLKSEMKYMYVPELGYLLEKKENKDIWNKSIISNWNGITEMV